MSASSNTTQGLLLILAGALIVAQTVRGGAVDKLLGTK